MGAKSVPYFSAHYAARGVLPFIVHVVGHIFSNVLSRYNRSSRSGRRRNSLANFYDPCRHERFANVQTSFTLFNLPPPPPFSPSDFLSCQAFSKFYLRQRRLGEVCPSCTSCTELGRITSELQMSNSSCVYEVYLCLPPPSSVCSCN